MAVKRKVVGDCLKGGGCEIDLNLNFNAHWLINVEVEVVNKM